MPIQLLSESDQVQVRDSDIVQGGDLTVVYTVRKITPEKQRELVKRHTRAGNNRRPETVNLEELQEDQIDYALVAWSGVVDGTAPAECSRENKLRMDMARRYALIERAGMAEVIAETKAESFRGAS
jgi:hypothetical protein